MGREVIYSSGAPSSPLYSQGIRAGNLLFLSGFVGMDPATKQLAGDTVEEQTRQAIRNCASVLSEAGSGLSDVVQVIVLLGDPTDFDGMNKEYAKAFPEAPPRQDGGKAGREPPKGPGIPCHDCAPQRLKGVT